MNYIKESKPSQIRNSMSKKFFDSEKEMQEWLSNQLSDEKELTDLIQNIEEFDQTMLICFRKRYNFLKTNHHHQLVDGLRQQHCLLW